MDFAVYFPLVAFGLFNPEVLRNANAGLAIDCCRPIGRLVAYALIFCESSCSFGILGLRELLLELFCE
jgi:hypothetical protein